MSATATLLGHVVLARGGRPRFPSPRQRSRSRPLLANRRGEPRRSRVRPGPGSLPGVSHENWFAVQRWIDISNDRYGVTWATPDTPLVEIGGITANLIGSLSDPRAWLDRLAPSTTIYSWAMNNHWHTNYRAEQEGPTVFHYWLEAHPGGGRGPDHAARFATAISQPYLVTPARGEPPRARSGREDYTPAGLAGVSPDDVLVTAFKPSEDGQAWIVRLFGASGKTRQAKLRWRDPAPKTTRLSDNSELPRQAVNGPVEVPGFGHRDPARRPVAVNNCLSTTPSRASVRSVKLP